MKKFLLLLFAASGGFSLLRAADCKITATEVNDGFVRRTLSNKYIAVDVMPQINSMISGMHYLPEKRELFVKQTIEVEHDDLLPMRPFLTGGGIKDYIWQADTSTLIPHKIISSDTTPEAATLVTSDRWFRLLNCQATKTIILKRDSTAFLMNIKLQNFDKKTLVPAIWQSVVQSLGEEKSLDTTVMPVKGNVRASGKRNVTFFEKDNVFREKDLSVQEFFIAPAKPWIAAINESKPGVLAMCVENKDIGSDAFFYTYKKNMIHTMEFILNSATIKTGECAEFNIAYVFFPALTNISEVAVCNDVICGIYARTAKNAMNIDMQFSAPVSTMQWDFILTGKDGKVFPIGKYDSPAVAPDEIVKISLPLPSIPAGEYVLSGKSAECTFSVLENFPVK